MLYKNGVRVVVVLMAIAVMAGPAYGGYSLQFEQGSYTTTSGSTVDLKLYLVEDGSTVLQTDGLAGAGVLVSWSDATVANIVSTSAITENPDFDFVIDKSITGSTASLEMVSFPLAFADSQGRVLLATYQFSALSAGTTTVDASILVNPGFSYFVTGNNQELDSVIQGGTTSIQVDASPGNPVPAPPSILLALIAGVCLVGYCWARGHLSGSTTQWGTAPA